MFDLVIKNGEIIDGTGKQGFVGDIGIKDGKIKAIGKLDAQDRPTIDAEGLVVSPGFIDIHSHSDFTLFVNRRGESKIRQGITTEVTGNCGFTAAPVTEEHFDDLIQYLANTVILSDEEKAKWKWPSQADFLQEIQGDEGFSFNLAPLVGHGTIKVGVMGFDKSKPASEVMDRMLGLLQAEMDRGLFGLSTGLQYEPCLYSDTQELIELAKKVKEYGGIFSFHLESESEGLVRCISQALEVAEKSGVSLQISHLKAAFRPNWGMSTTVLDMIDDAKQAGINVDFDVYPYVAYGSGLIDLMRPWVREQGAGKMVELLKDDSIRTRVIREMDNPGEDWENPAHGCGWDNIRIAMLKTEANRKYEGMSVQQIADHMGLSPAEATVKLMIEEEAAIKAIYFAMSEEDLINIMKHPDAIFATDGRAVAPYGPLGRGSVHPRYYGTYPRILGRYVREKQIIPLEEAIKKMTYLPAKKVGLKQRGLLKEGYWADITIFDKHNVIDVATFDNPHQYPVGIEYVLVSGQLVIEKGEHTGKLPGRVLKRGQA